MYEAFEHTADLGLRIQAPELHTLFAEAGEALFAAIVENLERIRPVESRSLSLRNDAPELLLFDWLNELLYLCDTQHLLFNKFDVNLKGNHLEATVWGEPRDRERHQLSHEVKAITYHGLRLDQVPGGWLAEVIVDI